MGRAPCCDKVGLKRGPWQPEEDEKLIAYIREHGHENWRALPQKAGLLRCGKSCRLRWTNYLRPDIKRGGFSIEEDHMIIQLHSILGNRWSVIAAHIPGRTDNEIKNYWNTHLRKQLLQMGVDPVTHRFKQQMPGTSSVFNQMALWETARFQAESRLAREYLSFLSRKQPLGSKNKSRDNDQIFAEWLQEYFKSFGKYLAPSDNSIDPMEPMEQPLDMSSFSPWPPSAEASLSSFSSQQLSESCSFASTSSDSSTLPQLSEQDVGFADASLQSNVGSGIGLGDDEYAGAVTGEEASLHGTMLQELSTVIGVPPREDELAGFGTTCSIDGTGESASQISPISPTFVLSPLDSSLAEGPAENLDLLELSDESMASNSDYWSTILRIVGT